MSHSSSPDTTSHKFKIGKYYWYVSNTTLTGGQPRASMQGLGCAAGMAAGAWLGGSEQNTRGLQTDERTPRAARIPAHTATHPRPVEEHTRPAAARQLVNKSTTRRLDRDCVRVRGRLPVPIPAHSPSHPTPSPQTARAPSLSTRGEACEALRSKALRSEHLRGSTCKGLVVGGAARARGSVRRRSSRRARCDRRRRRCR